MILPVLTELTGWVVLPQKKLASKAAHAAIQSASRPARAKATNCRAEVYDFRLPGLAARPDRA
jgi:hypothetical protein